MSLPVKLGVAGTLVAGSTVTYFGVFHFAMPTGVPLSKDSNNTSIYSSKYAADYQQFLVEVKSPSSDSISNDAWGNGVFKHRYDEEKAQGGFGKSLVKGGAKGSTETDKSLQEVCEKAYKAANSSVVDDTVTSLNVNTFKESDVGKFCTAVGEKPKTISKAADGSLDKLELQQNTGNGSGNKIGYDKQADLLAIYAKENEYAGSILDEQFREKNLDSGFFSKPSSLGASIKGRCEAAYRLPTSELNQTNKPTDTELYKGCSLKGKSAS